MAYAPTNKCPIRPGSVDRKAGSVEQVPVMKLRRSRARSLAQLVVVSVFAGGLFAAAGGPNVNSPIGGPIGGVVLAPAALATMDDPVVPVGDGCATAHCHTEYANLRFSHGPVALGRCLSCHEEYEDTTSFESGEDHVFAMRDRDGHLCHICHEATATDTHVHYPLRLAKCLDCHDPHGSNNAGMMRHETMSDNCYECHERTMDDDTLVHAPVRVGACTICHDPHSSGHEQQLVAGEPQLCFRCHAVMEERLSSSRHAHRPMMEKCTHCHSPHDSEHGLLLRDSVPELCYGCHQDMQDHVAKASKEHGALEQEGSCLICHDPHVTDHGKQLKAAPIDLCLTCHGKSVVGRERVLRDMAAFLEANPDHHGPIRTGDCAACHDPHGSSNAFLLAKSYPEHFYAPFDVQRYELCFSCHEQSLVLDPETSTLTNFRNGDVNLHFAHVNQDRKGRTCRACHDVHGSVHPKHVADTVPFGSWDLPIAYEKNESGGSCSPGCHTPRAYDRLNPVEND